MSTWRSFPRGVTFSFVQRQFDEEWASKDKRKYPGENIIPVGKFLKVENGPKEQEDYRAGQKKISGEEKLIRISQVYGLNKGYFGSKQMFFFLNLVLSCLRY